MANDQLPGAEDEGVAALLLAMAERLLGASQSKIPRDFVGSLFARAVPEDLVRYDAREVAALAEAAWSFLADRPAGAPRIRFEQPAFAGDRLRQVSVLEIVNDDMPFLVDSVMGELAEQGVETRLVVHPIFAVARDPDGHLTAFHGVGSAGPARRESFIHIHVERIEEEARRAEIVTAIAQALADVRVCVADWRAMLNRVSAVIAGLKTDPPPLPADEVAEAIEFLGWLMANNFTFLGVRNYAFTTNQDALEPHY